MRSDDHEALNPWTAELGSLCFDLLLSSLFLYLFPQLETVHHTTASTIPHIYIHETILQHLSNHHQHHHHHHHYRHIMTSNHTPNHNVSFRLAAHKADLKPFRKTTVRPFFFLFLFSPVLPCVPTTSVYVGIPDVRVCRTESPPSPPPFLPCVHANPCPKPLMRITVL